MANVLFVLARLFSFAVFRTTKFTFRAFESEDAIKVPTPPAPRTYTDIFV